MGNVVSLSKGGVVNLSKQAPGLKHVMVGLGWDPVIKEPQAATAEVKRGLFGFKKHTAAPVQIPHADDIDCDASAVLLVNGKFETTEDTVYFGNLKHNSKSVIHQGDNLTGEGEGDDEQIFIDLDKVPSKYTEIVLFVNIYRAFEKGQNFGMLQNTFIRLVNNETGKEVCRYDISDSEQYRTSTAVIFGKLKRNNGSWEFEALGEPTHDRSVSDITRRFN